VAWQSQFHGGRWWEAMWDTVPSLVALSCGRGTPPVAWQSQLHGGTGMAPRRRGRGRGRLRSG